MGISGQQETTARSTGRSLRRGLLAVSATGLLVLTGCGDRGDDPQPAVSEEGPVLVGAGPTVQTQAVADAWVLALEDSGIAAEVREVEGGRAGYLQAVEDGTVDVYPDFTGDLYLELDAASAEQSPAEPTPSPGGEAAADSGGLIDSLTSLVGQDPGTAGFSDADVEAAVQEQLPDGLTLLATGSADRTRAMAVTAATGAQLSGSTLDSLSGDCSKMTIGVPNEETEQPVTVPALEELYGCEPQKVVGYGSPEETVEALLRDDVQAAVVVTTRPEIQDNALVVLEDGSGAMIPERVVPVADDELPQNVQDVIDDVDGRLDADAMTLLTRMTTSQDLYTPYEAADYWWGTQN